MQATDLPQHLAAFAERFDARLADCVGDIPRVPPRLHEAIRYALLSHGKRLRPFLVHECCRATGGDPAHAFAPGAAIEMVHAFSLTHDDLPAMDDDDLRRGQPTTHKQYDEATAILVGDALLTLAFETLARGVPDPEAARQMSLVLAEGTGWQGMIAGQVADLEGERLPPEVDRVRTIHEQKTAALISAACQMGGIAAGAAPEARACLAAYGRHLGVCFQIADDLLDVHATADEVGKATGKDAARRKQTYPASVGTSRSRELAAEAARAATAALGPLGERAAVLVRLADFVHARSR